jgi:hypothetical protein
VREVLGAVVPGRSQWFADEKDRRTGEVHGQERRGGRAMVS